jgi:hypothetical protein
MSDQDGLVVDMHRWLGFLRATPPAADQDTLERLLVGRLSPADAPAGYAGLAGLLAAVAAPAAPEELAGEQLMLAEFKAVVQSPPPTLAPRRANMLSKLASVKAAAAVLAAVLSIGGVAAAATGLLPDRAEQAADQAPSTTGAGAARHRLGEAAAVDLGAAAKTGLCQAWQAGRGADHGGRAESPAFRALAVGAGGADNVAAYCKDAAAGGSADRQGRAAAAGPDALAAAQAGLCQAWQAGEGADHGRRADSVAFQALAAAAGGADKVADFCQGTAAGSAGSQRKKAPSSTPSTTVSPPSSGPPASTSQGGHGQGGPPTTS